MKINHYMTPDVVFFFGLVFVACLIAWWLHRAIGSFRSRGLAVSCGQHVLHLLLSVFAGFAVLSALLGRPAGFHNPPQGYQFDLQKPFELFHRGVDFMYEYHPQKILVEEGLGGLSWVFNLDTYLLLAWFVLLLWFFLWVTPLTAFYLVSSVWYTLSSLGKHVFTKSCGCHLNKVDPVLERQGAQK
ncbi:hypothetical protein ACTXM3_08625 [Glutamicibacter arilaitensis]|uniref:hypothetical protein n=1 Tax=Glutamicibacter arilaitensis TaxID=256701 RepID=UPI003FD02CFE